MDRRGFLGRWRSRERQERATNDKTEKEIESK